MLKAGGAGLGHAWEARAACQEEARREEDAEGQDWGPLGHMSPEASSAGKGVACKNAGKMERGGVTSVGLGSELDTAPCRGAPGPLLWTS